MTINAVLAVSKTHVQKISTAILQIVSQTIGYAMADRIVIMGRMRKNVVSISSLYHRNTLHVAGVNRRQENEQKLQKKMSTLLNMITKSRIPMENAFKLVNSKSTYRVLKYIMQSQIGIHTNTHVIVCTQPRGSGHGITEVI